MMELDLQPLKLPKWELLTRRERGRDCLVAGKAVGAPDHVYTESGTVKILRSCSGVDWPRARNNPFHIREIRKIKTQDGRVEMWATPTERTSVYFPLDCLWYQIVPLTEETRIKIEASYAEWHKAMTEWAARDGRRP